MTTRLGVSRITAYRSQMLVESLTISLSSFTKESKPPLRNDHKAKPPAA
jgi:hypothetical protein